MPKWLQIKLAEQLHYGMAWKCHPTQQWLDYRSLAISSVLFGVTHSLWTAGIIAGAAYGALAVKTERIGEAVAAHATTNLLIAIQVLLFGAWQLW